MNRLALPLGFVLFIVALMSGATVRAQTLSFNAPVNAIARALDGTVYVGGEFTAVGTDAGGGVPVDIESGALRTLFQRVDGRVYAAISDGVGGFYIGGTFFIRHGEFHTLPIKNLAHIFPDGTLDSSWRPEVDGTVYALAMFAGKLIAGGAFSVAGKNEKIIGVHPDGVVYSLGLMVSGTVHAFAVSPQALYFGGSFYTVAGQQRKNLAAIDVNGTLTSWNPGANSTVLALALSNSTLYVGGQFTEVAGQRRNRLAAVTIAGVLTPWNPDADALVYALVVSGNTVYVGGVFSTVRGESRSFLTGVVASGNGTLTAWNPRPNGYVTALAVGRRGILVGGEFSRIGNSRREQIALFDPSPSGSLLTWGVGGVVAGPVSAIATSGENVYLAGTGLVIHPKERDRLAAFDSQDRLTDWNPSADGAVDAIAIGDGVIYVGGRFSRAGENVNSGPYLAAIDQSAVTQSWSPNLNGPVQSLLFASGRLFVGGEFTYVRGQSRQRLAVFDSRGEVLPWGFSVNGTVRSLAVMKNTLYAGGDFTTIDGAARGRIAAFEGVSSSSFLLTAFNPGVANGRVNAIVAKYGVVYLGGEFTRVAGVDRYWFAAVNQYGALTNLNPSLNMYVRAMGVEDGQLYIGGVFNNIDGQPRYGAAAIGLHGLYGGVVTNWNPGARPSGVRALSVATEGVYLGGGFYKVDTSGSGARFTRTDRNALPLDPAKNIFDNLVKSQDHSTFVSAVKASGLVDPLSSPGPFTVFVATNAAFDQLPVGTVDRLLKPEMKVNLVQLLNYHIVPAKLSVADLAKKVKAFGGKARLKTVQGAELTVSLDGNKVIVTDESGNRAQVTLADINQSNGVIHVIDTVLLPK